MIFCFHNKSIRLIGVISALLVGLVSVNVSAYLSAIKFIKVNQELAVFEYIDGFFIFWNLYPPGKRFETLYSGMPQTRPP